MALEVDADDGVPVLLGQVEAHAVAQDPRVVHEDVEPAEHIDRLADEPLGTRPGRDVVVVGDRFATPGDDLVRDLLRGRLVGTFALARPAEVVDDDFGALAREQQRLAAADPSARARHDRDFAVERTHAFPPRSDAEPY